MDNFIVPLIRYLELQFKGRTAMLPEIMDAVNEITEDDSWPQEFYLKVYRAYLNKVSMPQA
jgi:hypothetical protein